MKSLLAVLAVSVLGLGCGIPEAVGDECGPYRSAYEMYQNKAEGLATRGVAPDAPIVRNTQQQLAEARAAVNECTAGMAS